jgi:hypothetical protein
MTAAHLADALTDELVLVENEDRTNYSPTTSVNK